MNRSYSIILALWCLLLVPGCSNKPEIPPSEVIWESSFDSQCCDSYEVNRRFTSDSIELSYFYSSIIKSAKHGRPYEKLGIDYKNWGIENAGINGNAKGGWYIDKDYQVYCYAEPLSRNRWIRLFCSEDEIRERSLYGIKLHQFTIGEREYQVSYHY